MLIKYSSLLYSIWVWLLLFGGFSCSKNGHREVRIEETREFGFNDGTIHVSGRCERDNTFSGEKIVRNAHPQKNSFNFQKFQFESGRVHGKVEVRKDGEIYINRYAHGVLTASSGRSSEGYLLSRVDIDNGHRNGEAWSWYPNGISKTMCTFKNGLKHGNCYRWSDEKQLKYMLQFENGKTTGKEVYWNDKGHVLYQSSLSSRTRARHIWLWNDSGVLVHQLILAGNNQLLECFDFHGGHLAMKCENQNKVTGLWAQYSRGFENYINEFPPDEENLDYFLLPAYPDVLSCGDVWTKYPPLPKKMENSF